jgi:hypothetical protein
MDCNSLTERAKAEVREAWRGTQNLYADGRMQAEAQARLWAALVRLVRAYVARGAKSAAEVARDSGVALNAALQRAWDNVTAGNLNEKATDLPRRIAEELKTMRIEDVDGAATRRESTAADWLNTPLDPQDPARNWFRSELNSKSPRTYAPFSDKEAIRSAQDYVSAFPSPEGAFSEVMRDMAAGSVEPMMGMLILTEVANVAGELSMSTGNPVDRDLMRTLSVRAIEAMRSMRSTAGQNLRAAQTSNKMLAAGFFAAEWAAYLREQQRKFFASIFPEVVSEKIKAWLLESQRIAIENLHKRLSKADALVSRALNTERRALDTTWREIFTSSARAQGSMRVEILRRVASHPMLEGLNREEQVELANLLLAAWMREWQTVFRREFAKVVKLPTVEPANVQRLLAATPKLIEWINIGLLSNEAFRDAIAPEFGLRSLSDVSVAEIYQMGQEAQTKPEGFSRQTAYRELYKRMSQLSGVPFTQFIQAWWYASVLSGMSTQGRNIVGNTTLLADNLVAYSVREPSMAVRLAFTAVRAFRDAAMIDFRSVMSGAEADSMVAQDITDAGSALEVLAKDTEAWKRMFGSGRFVSRFMVAVDAMYYSANAHMAAMFDISRAVKGMGQLSQDDAVAWAESVLFPKPESFEYQSADTQAREEAANGLLPDTQEYTISRRRNEIIRARLPIEVQQRMVSFGLEGTLNKRPEGFIGMVASQIIAARKQYPILVPIVPFVRISANVTEMFLDHSPAALFKLVMARPEVYANEGSNSSATLSAMDRLRFPRYPNRRLTLEQWQMLRAKMVVSHAVAMGVLALAASFLDDDEPAFEVTGSFDILNPTQRKQLEASGIKPYQIRIMGIGFDYRQTPAALMFAIVGNLMDGMKYGKNPDREVDPAKSFAAAMAAGHAVIIDQQFLSGIASLIGRGGFGGAQANAWVNLMRSAGRTVGGLIPNLAKEFDSMVNPGVYGADGFLTALQRETPIARWQLDPMFNVLGEDIERRKLPWNWLVNVGTDDPVWSELARVSRGGAFLSSPSAAAKVTRYGQRVPMTDEETTDYQRRVGIEYRKILEANLGRLRNMSPQEARDWFQSSEFSRARERVRATM